MTCPPLGGLPLSLCGLGPVVGSRGAGGGDTQARAGLGGTWMGKEAAQRPARGPGVEGRSRVGGDGVRGGGWR